MIFIPFLSGCKTSTNHLTNELRPFTSYDSSWIFFDLEKKIKVKVIEHIKNNTLCGTVAAASVTFVIDEEGEIFRVIDTCNLSNYKKDEIIILIPANKPDRKVSLPFKIFVNHQTNKNESSELDKATVNTTYAEIEKITQ